jgi:hypothetical protein
VVEQKQWLTAPDCCDICAKMDGDVVGLEDTFFDDDYGDGMSPPLHPNCVLPGTLCETPGGLIIGLRSWYRGEAIELTFAQGTRLSVTPNHLLLTPNGFAPAHLLREGDDVFYCPDTKGVVSSHPNDDRKPALVEEIVGTLAKSSGMAIRRVPVTPEYLHGDGRFCNGDIDVIGPDSLLADTRKTARAQCLGTDSLNWTDIDSPNLPSSGSLAEILVHAAHTADSIVGGFRQPSSFFLSRLSHSNEHGLTPATGCDSSTEQSHADSTSADLEIFSQEQLGFSRKIKTTKVIDVNRFAYVGHVYDLQTITSLYICNSIVSSNCRCSVLPVVE